MAEADLLRFLDKVSQLQALAAGLERDSDRRSQLAACSNHNQVVELARSWGFEIGRRWGDGDSIPGTANNLFNMPCPEAGCEQQRLLVSGDGWSLKLIASNDFSSPPDTWMDQQENEWVLVLKGTARLQLGSPDQVLDLSAGDHLMIPAHQRHRVERTDPAPGTLWIALHWHV